jgi:AcrR family transcriptional regulator
MTRADIIQAAFKAWGKDRYRSTSLSKVARELGVSKTALYRHFSNKQALLEAMYEWFLDDYAAKIMDGLRQAAACGPREAMATVARAILGYFARNLYMFIFSLVYVYGDRPLGNSHELLIKRGLNMGVFDEIQKLSPSPQITRLVLATLTFAMAYFHRLAAPERAAPERAAPERAAEDGAPTEEEIERNISLALCIIFQGLGFHKEEADALDYAFLEGKVSGISRNIEENDLLHSVAEAVAGAGPWAVSMEMVARVSGLSKSGLYAHFTNKRDMLAQLFATEFDRIIDFAEKSMEFSADPAERLYLAVFAICDYLRSRPDVLIALDWLRARRIGIPEPGEQRVLPRFYRIFRDIQNLPELKRRFSGITDEWIPAWVLFLTVAALTQCVQTDTKQAEEWLNTPKDCRRKLSREEFAKIPNESFRNLYRFIVRGIGDFAPEAVYGNCGNERVRQ